MNPLMVTGSVLGLAGVVILNARDYAGGRRFTWLIWLLLSSGAAALSLSGAGYVRVITAAVVVPAGGTLITVAFIAAKTGRPWSVIARQMNTHDRQHRRKRKS